MNEAEALARIDALETRIAHQEHTIEDLNRSVTQQWETIDRLAKQLERMTERLTQFEQNAPSPEGPEPPPPHY